MSENRKVEYIQSQVKITIEENESGNYFIHIYGSIDSYSSTKIQNFIKNNIKKDKRVYFDCTHLKEVSSVGMGIFLILTNITRHIYFYNMNLHISKIFEMLGFDNMFFIFKDLKELKESFHYK